VFRGALNGAAYFCTRRHRLSIKRELISFAFCQTQREKLGIYFDLAATAHTHNTVDEARGSHYIAADEKKMRKEEIDTHAIIVESTSLLVTALLFLHKIETG
jgi:hypothetical protein